MAKTLKRPKSGPTRIHVSLPGTESADGILPSEIGGEPSGDDNPIDGANQQQPDGDAFVDPRDIESAPTGDNSDSGTGTAGGRRRGRPRGSKGGARNSRTSQTSQNIEGLLFSLHMMGAAFLKMPELALAPEEAKQLAQAVNRVSDLYEIAVIPEKTLAWIQLGMVASTVYGPRFVVMASKKKQQSKPKVIDFKPPITTAKETYGAEPKPATAGYGGGTPNGQWVSDTPVVGE